MRNSTNLHSPQQCTGFLFPISLPASVVFFLVRLLMIGILNGMKWTLQEVLVSISLKAKTGEKVKHLLAMCSSSFEKCLLFIGPFIDWMICLF